MRVSRSARGDRPREASRPSAPASAGRRRHACRRPSGRAASGSAGRPGSPRRGPRRPGPGVGVQAGARVGAVASPRRQGGHTSVPAALRRRSRWRRSPPGLSRPSRQARSETPRRLRWTPCRRCMRTGGARARTRRGRGHGDAFVVVHRRSVLGRLDPVGTLTPGTAGCGAQRSACAATRRGAQDEYRAPPPVRVGMARHALTTSRPPPRAPSGIFWRQCRAGLLLAALGLALLVLGSAPGRSAAPAWLNARAARRSA